MPDTPVGEICTERDRGCDPDCKNGPRHCLQVHWPLWKRTHRPEACNSAWAYHERKVIEAEAAESLVRDILVALCERDGLSLDSDAEPGSPARNYELALRLRIGQVFDLNRGESADA